MRRCEGASSGDGAGKPASEHHQDRYPQPMRVSHPMMQVSRLLGLSLHFVIAHSSMPNGSGAVDDSAAFPAPSMRSNSGFGFRARSCR